MNSPFDDLFHTNTGLSLTSLKLRLFVLDSRLGCGATCPPSPTNPTREAVCDSG